MARPVAAPRKPLPAQRIDRRFHGEAVGAHRDRPAFGYLEQERTRPAQVEAPAPGLPAADARRRTGDRDGALRRILA
jgi:hypothetical protein